MALSSFSGVNFRVLGDQNGFYPLIVRDQDGAPRYKATIRLSSPSDYAALADAVSMVTVKRALGTFAYSVEIEAGPAPASLVVPINAKNLGTFTALLTAFSPRAFGRNVNDIRADAEWLILSDITP
jgi:hypothetical protein